MPICNSWSAAARHLCNRLNDPDVRVLTVDVFDTLLLRGTSPDFVERSTASILAKQAGITYEKAKDARGRAWRLATAKAVSSGLDPDCKSQEYFSNWVRLAIGDTKSAEEIQAISDQLLTHEIFLEAICLSPNPAMKEVIAAARAKGVFVYALSDMYLSSDEVRGLLDVHGMSDGIEQVITSGDIGLQKRSGRLFQRFMKDYKLNPSEIVHIGDDLVADWQKPRELGIASFGVRDRDAMWSRAHVRKLENGVAQREGMGYALEEMSKRLSRRGADPLYEAGRTGFGPIYAAFLHGIVERVLGNFDSVWFMAREGWMLLELYEMARLAGWRNLPPSGYLYISRLSSLRASMEAFGPDQVGNILNNSPNPTYGKFMVPFGFSSADEILAEAGFNASDRASHEGAAKIVALPSFQGLTQSVGSVERANLNRYLDLTGFPKSGKVAVVDVGWGGQIQENFQRALSMMGRNVEICGLYLGTDHRAQMRRAAGLDIEALVVDGASPYSSGKGAFAFVQGLELATRSPHGSVLGYGEDGIPILDANSESRAKEALDDASIARLQVGILEYGKAWFPLAKTANIDARQSAASARASIDLLCLAPEKKTAGALLGLNNVANLGMDEGLLLGRKVTIFKPRALLAALRETLWQEGTLSWAGGPYLALLLLAYRQLRKRKSSKPPVVQNVTAPTNNAAVPVGTVPVKDSLGLDIGTIRNKLAGRQRYIQPKGAATAHLGRVLRSLALSRLSKQNNDMKENWISLLDCAQTYVRNSVPAELAKMALRRLR